VLPIATLYKYLLLHNIMDGIIEQDSPLLNGPAEFRATIYKFVLVGCHQALNIGTSSPACRTLVMHGVVSPPDTNYTSDPARLHDLAIEPSYLRTCHGYHEGISHVHTKHLFDFRDVKAARIFFHKLAYNVRGIVQDVEISKWITRKGPGLATETRPSDTLPSVQTAT